MNSATAALKINTTETALKAKGSKAKGSKASKPKTATRAKLRMGDKVRASAFAMLALCGLGVSLPHLASEVGLLTGAEVLGAWLVALVIDCGMIVCKAHVAANGPKQAVAWGVLGSCTVVSIVLNCHAFLTHASEGFGQIAAVGFGIFLPLFILALSFLASEILLGHKD